MKRKLLLLVLSAMLAFSGCGVSEKNQDKSAVTQENKTPEEILSEEILGEWEFSDEAFSFWFSKDGTGIITEGENEYDMTWRIVKTNELKFSTQNDEDSLTVDAIDDSSMNVTWDNHKYTLTRVDKSVSVKVDDEENISENTKTSETSNSSELKEEAKKIVGNWGGLVLLPNGTAFCNNVSQTHLIPDGVGTYTWNEDASTLNLKLENPYTHLSIDYHLHASEISDDGDYTNMFFDNLYGDSKKSKFQQLFQRNSEHMYYFADIDLSELDSKLSSAKATRDFFEFSTGYHYRITLSDSGALEYCNGTYEGTWEFAYSDGKKLYGLLLREANLLVDAYIKDGEVSLNNIRYITNKDQSELLDWYIP